jgi:biotin-(acetyl-CoA carboxylase) ligase
MTELSLPPLFQSLQATDEAPFDMACRLAADGCDAGTVTYALRPDILRAAIVFAPEVPLRQAAIMLPICGVGFQNALGALAPPEVSVHLEWTGKIRVNGGVAGSLSMAARPADPDRIPDWLVVGLEIAFWPAEEESGLTPDVTALFVEGCADIEGPALLEAWTRHTLVWINRWLEDGPRAVHSEWTGLAHGLKETATQGDATGSFIGVDENFGMILQFDAGTQIIPLTDILTEAT